MPAVVEQIIRDEDLSTSTKVIYLYIAASYRLSYYSNPHDCGSYGDLAKETNFSVTTVRKALKQLETVGLLSIEAGSDKFESWLKVKVLHLDEGLNLLRRLANAGGA
jgi:DNA-binding transcriptional regulator YhcF (GntR family)